MADGGSGLSFLGLTKLKTLLKLEERIRREKVKVSKCQLNLQHRQRRKENTVFNTFTFHDPACGKLVGGNV